MSRFLRKTLQGDPSAFCNYALRGPAAVDLSLVSGPFIWHDEVARALDTADRSLVHTYPLPCQLPELSERLAAHEGVDTNVLYLTSGADSAIEIVLNRYLAAGDTFGILTPNFPRFAIVAATIPGIDIVEFDDLASVPDGAKLVSVCTPNNPSTQELPADLLRRTFIEHPDTLFCLDGVFDWYGSYSLVDVCRDLPNVLILKSFSKIGLAGLRLGYVIAPPELIADLQIGTTPFAVSTLVQTVGLEVARSFSRLPDLHEIIERDFAPINATFGEQVVRHSPVPFYLLKSAVGSARGAELLAQEGIATVDRAHCPSVPAGYLRVSIGTPEQNERLTTAVDRLGIVK